MPAQQEKRPRGGSWGGTADGPASGQGAAATAAPVSSSGVVGAKKVPTRGAGREGGRKGGKGVLPVGLVNEGEGKGPSGTTLSSFVNACTQVVYRLPTLSA